MDGTLPWPNPPPPCCVYCLTFCVYLDTMVSMTRRELLARLTAAAERAAKANEELRKVLLEAVDDHASLSEIGDALGISRQTARGRIRAARRDLNQGGSDQ